MRHLMPLLLFLSSAALAESGAYRVEVIVFRNLAVTAEATEVETLRSFSAYPALEEPVLAVEHAVMTEYGPATSPPELEPPAKTNKVLEGEEAETPRFDLPDDLRVIVEKSRAVDDAWRRLRGSKNYRPLLYAAWEQNRVDYYPPMHIHDQHVIDTQLRPPTVLMFADLTAADPLAAYRSTFYLLDGSVQLRRSRFLHLYLDLEIREPKPQTETTFSTALQGPAPQPDTGPYKIFTLQQNRQIRTGRMHYFDTPQFGALVLVTAISPE